MTIQTVTGGCIHVEIDGEEGTTHATFVFIFIIFVATTEEEFLFLILIVSITLLELRH